MDKINFLPRAQAFNSGSDLWVSLLDPNSKWIPEFDWYLNFMISGFFHRTQTERPKALLDIVEGCEIESVNLKTPVTSLNEPLLIQSSKFLPNKYFLLVPNSDLELLGPEFKKAWLKLGKPSTRFFISSKVNTQDFNRAITSLDSMTEFSAVIA